MPPIPDDCIHEDDLPDHIRDDPGGEVHEAIMEGWFDASVRARCAALHREVQGYPPKEGE